MNFSMKSKVLAASAMTLLMLSSCGQPPLNQDADPAQVLKDARANFVTAASSMAEKTASGTEKGTLEANLVNPDATADLNGSYEFNMNSQNQIDATVNLGGTVSSSATGKIDAEASVGVRLLETTLYANLMNLKATAEQAVLQSEIDTYLQAANLFSNKWLQFDLIELIGATEEEAAALKEAMSKDNLELTKMAIAKLNDHEIFTVQEKLETEDGMYVYKVIPNKAEVTALLEEVMTAYGTPATPETLADIEQILDALASENVTHKLYIDGDNNYRKFVSTGNITSPEVNATITSTMTFDKDLNGTWVLDVKANNPAGSENFTLMLNAENKNLDGSFDISFDAPFMNTTFKLQLDSSFKSGTPEVEVPADAVDFTQIMGGAPVSATGTAMEEETAPQE